MCALQENVPDEERVSAMRENTYVRICGHVRSFQGKTNVVAFHVSPVEDANQITCHILGVIYAHASSNMVIFFLLTTLWIMSHIMCVCFCLLIEL